MPLIEPDVSEEKLRQLLAEGHESEGLDYKTQLDLRGTGDRVELAKDIAAMQVDGGFIIIGADDHGVLTGEFHAAHADLTDESKLRSILTKWIPEPLALRVGRHNLDGKLVALIFVGPRPDGFSVFKADGQYVHPVSGKEVCAFRRGDVFVRHGSASERWQQHDIERIRQRMRDRDKQEWFREVTVVIERVTNERHAQALATGPTAVLNWHLDEETFRSCVVQYLRTNDTIPLLSFLVSVPRDVLGLVRESDASDVDEALTRVACLAATALVLERQEWFERAVEQLVRSYDQALDLSKGYIVLAERSVRLWVSIAACVMALGALAVRLNNWSAVRTLALQRCAAVEAEGARTWLRHAITAGARYGAFRTVQLSGGPILGALVELARALLLAHPCLRPDVGDDAERIIDSLCQFDILWNLHVISQTGEVSAATVYPGFAGYFARRSTPILERLLASPDLRQTIFPQSDEMLADGLRRLGKLANELGFSVGTWTGFDSEMVARFLAANRGE